MSWKLVTAVLESNLDRRLKLAAVALVSYARDDGSRVMPSIARLAWLIGVSRRHAQRSVTQLRSLGLLEAVRVAPSGTVEYQFRATALPRRPLLIVKQMPLPFQTSEPHLHLNSFPQDAQVSTGGDETSEAHPGTWVSPDLSEIRTYRKIKITGASAPGYRHRHMPERADASFRHLCVIVRMIERETPGQPLVEFVERVKLRCAKARLRWDPDTLTRAIHAVRRSA